MAKTFHNSATTAPTITLTRGAKGWVKKIGGRAVWLAPLDKPQLAMERCLAKMAAHAAGAHLAPPVTNNNATLGVLGDLFIAAKDAKATAGEIGRRTVKDYTAGVQMAVDHFGYDAVALNIPPGRWQAYRAILAAKLDPYSLQRHVGAVRSLSKWALGNEHVDRPFRFGTEFGIPSQKVMRAMKREGGAREFTAGDVKKILAAADPVVRALFLLALNGGIGNTDLAKLELRNLRLDAGVIEFQRSKTDVPRVIPLWPETVAALRAALPLRPDPKDAAWADRVFLTPTGRPLVRDHVGEDGGLTSTTDRIGMTFGKVAKAAGVARTFYDARRTFQTIGDEVGPEHVVKAIMGHTARGDDMSSRYRQSIPFEKLSAVVNHVRERLSVGESCGSGSAGSPAAAAKPARPSGTKRKPRRRPARTAK